MDLVGNACTVSIEEGTVTPDQTYTATPYAFDANEMLLSHDLCSNTITYTYEDCDTLAINDDLALSTLEFTSNIAGSDTYTICLIGTLDDMVTSFTSEFDIVVDVGNVAPEFTAT
jgi:hypothetical protein